MQGLTRSLGLCTEQISLEESLQRVAQQIGIEISIVELIDAADWLSERVDRVLLIDTEAEQFKAFVANFGDRPLGAMRRVIRLLSIDQQSAAAISDERCAVTPIDAPSRAEFIKQVSRGSLRAVERSPLASASAPTPVKPVTQDNLQTLDQTLLDAARRVCGVPVDVLIQGETGTGKDWLARFVHDNTDAQAPFIAVNCAAIPETLAESELFGHEAGSFTGAVKARAGKIEEADGGTLYLDEIDSCPLWLQAKLLRALQEKGVERVGSSKFRPSRFRLIASTKAVLPELVSQGRFRADLYFRLKVVELFIPAIRMQPDRLLKLFRLFVKEAAQQFSSQMPEINSSVDGQLLQHQWPGNIRELKAAAIRFALGLQPLSPEHQSSPAGMSLREALDACERSLLMSSLLRQGCVLKTSEELSIPLNTLYYRLKRLGINPKALNLAG